VRAGGRRMREREVGISRLLRNPTYVNDHVDCAIPLVLISDKRDIVSSDITCHRNVMCTLQNVTTRTLDKR